MLLVVSTATIASISGGPWTYLFVWLWLVGLLLWVPVGALVCEGSVPLRVGQLALGALAVCAAARVGVMAPPNATVSDGLAALASGVNALRTGSSVSLEERGDALIGYRPGVAIELVKAGHSLIVPRNEGFRWGPHRAGDPRTAEEWLTVAIGPAEIASLRARTGAPPLASFVPTAGADVSANEVPVALFLLRH